MNPDDYDLMKSNKDSLINIIRNIKIDTNKKTAIDIIHDAVYRVNKIVIHTYNFLKLYILYLYDNNLDIPFINENFVKMVMRVMSSRKDNRGGSKSNKKTIGTTKKLITFYNNFYKKTINKDDMVTIDKLGYLLAYEAIDIVKNINNNIKEHYVEHVNKFVNVSLEWKNKIAEINKMKEKNNEEKKQLRKKLYEDFFNVKKDLLNVENDKMLSPKKYHEWIKIIKYNIIPKKDKYQKNSINYDICCKPQDYLKNMIYINKELDLMGSEDNPIKLFNALPLRTRIIPNYITLDTASLVSLFVQTNQKEYFMNIKKKQKELWKKYFFTNKRVFKKGKYQFDYMIKTDGVACTILFIKLDSNNNSIKITKKKIMENEKLKENLDKQYIENQINVNKLLNNKNYVVIDPNLSDLMYCMDKNGKKFRYTQNQRRLETRNKKYNKIIEKINTETIIDGKTVKEVESELSKYNSKTCHFNEFLKYLKIKNKINRCLFKQYQEKIYRKLKWNRFINTQKSESKMLNNFEKAYPNPESTIVIIGDYDKGSNHMKGKEPCITKKIRKILRKRYRVYLINEYHTSKICNKCHCEVENFLKRKSHKPKDHGKEILVWGLVRCTNEKCSQAIIQNKKVTVRSIYNRDTNAVLNMLNIVKSLILTGKRPKIYTRKE
jgi:phage tail tube protein FII